MSAFASLVPAIVYLRKPFEIPGKSGDLSGNIANSGRNPAHGCCDAAAKA
jgi:hypothetical protein